MKLILDRNQLLERITSMMDITPTMYKNAESKYKSLANYFEEHGLDCDIYPQGSFALGTVIRPLKDGKERDYDLDFICCINSLNNLTAKEFRNKIWNILNESEIYSTRIKNYPKCFTLEYAEINGFGFNMDILPGKPKINNFIFLTAQNIDNKNDVKWFVSNPRDYINWFKNINDLYYEIDAINSINNSILIENSVEKLPSLFKRTPLQRVIQILKSHRNFFYYVKKKENKKVISAIITTLCCKIFQKYLLKNHNIIELLNYTISELSIYAQLLKTEKLDKYYKDKDIIRKNNFNWEILNPVNPSDNLADSWNEDPEKPKLFFEWIDALKQDLFTIDDKEYCANLTNIFGETNVHNELGNIIKKPSEIKPVKPWRK